MSRFESIEYDAPNGYKVKCLAMSVDSEDWKGLSVDEVWKGLSVDDNEQNLLEGDKRIYFWTDASARIFLGSLPTSDEYDIIKNKKLLGKQNNKYIFLKLYSFHYSKK